MDVEFCKFRLLMPRLSRRVWVFCWDRNVSHFPDDGSLVKTASFEGMTVKPLNYLNQMRVLRWLEPLVYPQ